MHQIKNAICANTESDAEFNSIALKHATVGGVTYLRNTQSFTITKRNKHFTQGEPPILKTDSQLGNRNNARGKVSSQVIQDGVPLN